MSSITINISSQKNDMPIYFYSACDYHLQEHIYHHAGNTNFHQILFVVKGSGILNIRNRSYTLTKGCAFYTAPHLDNEYKSTDGLVTAFLTVRGDALPPLLAHYCCDGFLFYESVNTERFILNINQIINEYRAHNRQGILSAYAYSFYVEFFQQKNNKPLTRLDEVMLYVEQNITKKHTLESLASIGCMSVSKLCHDFKAKNNCSVFKYIINLRLSYAQSLLLSYPNMKVKDAALSCGFDDVSYFCRAYKAKYGTSPSERIITQP